jgi:hypothetical protein
MAATPQHRVRPMADQLPLSLRPPPVDAVKWSEDNLIAVAAAHTVVISSPADLGGPRGYAAIEQQQHQVGRINRVCRQAGAPGWEAATHMHA